MGIEDGADLKSTEEGQEDVHGENPADGAFGIVVQKMLGNVRMVDADRVHHPEGSDKSHKGPQDDGPGSKATFRIGDLILVGARCGEKVFLSHGSGLFRVWLLLLRYRECGSVNWGTGAW